MLESRVAEVNERIMEACRRSGRPADSVVLLVVTKTQPRESVLAAIDCGLRVFGENRVQEAGAKFAGLLDRVELHLIGHLQSNKARGVPGLFSSVESIDSLHTAEALSSRLVAADRSCSVLLQYNSSREATKYGFTDASELLEAAEQVTGLPGLEVKGVMTIGPFTDDTAAIVRAFEHTRVVYDRLRDLLGDPVDVLSMGMTNDYEIAIAEGSTEVRVGTALFGERT